MRSLHSQTWRCSSPERSRPSGPSRPTITRPEYVGKAHPSPWTGGDVKDTDTIERMRIAGRLAAQAMEAAAGHVRPGVTTDELDRVGHEFLCDHGAYPSTLGYRGFPKSLCTSVNEVICHGIPDSTVLVEGDIVNIDVTAFIHGVHGDTDATYPSAKWTRPRVALIDRTQEAMMRGVRAVAPGREVSVIGRVIETYARRFGYGTVHDFTGHGIGEAFHSGLAIPHYDEPTGDDGDGGRHDVHDRTDADLGHDRLRRLG